MKFRWVCEKNHRNRTSGSRDIAPQSEKIIEFSRFFSKKFFIFTVKLTFDLKMKKKTFKRMQFLILKPKIPYVFFVRNFFTKYNLCVNADLKRLGIFIQSEYIVNNVLNHMFCSCINMTKKWPAFNEDFLNCKWFNLSDFCKACW